MAVSLNGGFIAHSAPAGAALAGEPAARSWQERAVERGHGGNGENVQRLRFPQFPPFSPSE